MAQPNEILIPSQPYEGTDQHKQLSKSKARNNHIYQNINIRKHKRMLYIFLCVCVSVYL